LLSALVVGAVAGCAGPEAPASTGPEAVLGDDAITVGSFDFAESEVLAQLDGQALAARGFEVRYAARIGPRELAQPALAAGLVEVLPEYAGTALHHLSLGAVPPTADVGRTSRALARAAEAIGLRALAPSPAQDANAVVVTPGTAREHGLRTVGDLRAVAAELTFGGPPECPTRPLCLAGLQAVYQVRFATFIPLDPGGPSTRQALEDGHIDVALLFTTEPALATGDLVALEDDAGLQPAENVTPLVRDDVFDRFGEGVADALDAVSAALTTDELRELDRRLAAGDGADAVAADWLTAEGLR
jgi:osmoprotectant transport system substrate-binding protein